MNQSRTQKSTPLYRRCLEVACLGWIVISGIRAFAAHEIARYDFRSWQSDEGLPQNSVHAIAQTPDGYLWVGTEKGLVRFDGSRFTVFDDSTSPSQEQSSINALLVTGDGALWIGTEGGGLLQRKDGMSRKFSRGKGLPGNNVRCLLQSKDGALWVGTDQGLARLLGGKSTFYNQTNGLTDIAVAAIAEDQLGIIRIATRSGLFSLDSNGVVTADNFGIGAIGYGLRTVYADHEGNLWFGGSGGLRYTEVAKDNPEIRSTDLRQQIITSFLQDSTGQHWVGTVRGVVRMSGNKVIGWPLNETASGDSIHTIFEDRESNIWVGGRDGLYRLRPARFVNYSDQQGLSANDVRSVCEDSAGAIWVASWVGGLSRIFEGRITIVRSTNGLTDDAVLSLRAANDGGLWVGMDFGRGLNKLNKKFRNVLPPTQGTISAPIRVIHEDSAGTVWLGTGKGLNVLRGDSVFTYTSTNGLLGNNVMAMIQDHLQNIWIGTDRGLTRWDGSGFKQFTSREGLSEESVNCLYEDANGTLWVGTKSGGLNRLRDGRFTTYSTVHGLFSDEIFEVVEDDSGYFWMTCRRGLFRVNKNDFAALDRGEISRLTCTVFGRDDGLATVQFNGVAKPAGLKARDGQLWFPTIRGVVTVDTRIKPNTLPPQVFIEEIIADRQPLRATTARTVENEVLDVLPGTHQVEIHYTALSLQSPERNRFRYRLEGVDEEWVDAGRRRVANYNLLRPGKYRFHVMGSNNDGVWSKAEASILINLHPHFWQTWWFEVLIVCALLVLLVGFYRLRVARLREIERLRIRIASDLHDDVGSRLTKVAMVSELADHDTPATDLNKPHFRNISVTVREIVRAMDEIVWTINPRNDTLDNLANYIFHYAQDYFQSTPVRCRLDLPAELPDNPISTEQRHNLFMTVKEALNNVLKHAAATEVRISLSNNGDLLRIVITDNGCGMNLDQANTTGNGLTNMKYRLHQIGGRLDIESKPGAGTTITMETRARRTR